MLTDNIETPFTVRVHMAHVKTSLALMPHGSDITDFMDLNDCHNVEDFFIKMHDTLAYQLRGEEITQIFITFGQHEIYERSIRIPTHNEVAFEAVINLIQNQPEETIVRMVGEVQSRLPRSPSPRGDRRVTLYCKARRRSHDFTPPSPTLSDYDYSKKGMRAFRLARYFALAHIMDARPLNGKRRARKAKKRMIRDMGTRQSTEEFLQIKPKYESDDEPTVKQECKPHHSVNIKQE